MLFRPRLGPALKGFAALAMLAGCSGGSQSLAPSGPVALPQQAARAAQVQRVGVPSFFPGRIAPGLHRPLLGGGFISAEVDAKGGTALYISDYDADTVTVFSTAGKQTAQVTGFSYPEGVTGDIAGNVYVDDTGASTIEKYSAGLKKLEATLADPGYYPSDASVVAKTGIVGVSNIASTTSGQLGSVVFYAKGGTTPCATVTDPNWAGMYFAAFDASGNLYIDGFSTQNTPLVGVVSGGCKARKVVTLAGASLHFPGGLQVAPNGDILIDDQGSSPSVVYTFKPPVKRAFGNPVSKTTLTGSGDAVAISLNATSKDLYDVDETLKEGQEFTYPGGTVTKTFTPSGVQEPLGVYVSPAEKP